MNRWVWVYSVGAGVCFAIAIYALLGVLQAYTSFSGNRAWNNITFWAPLAVVTLAGGGYCLHRALHISLLNVKTLIRDSRPR